MNARSSQAALFGGEDALPAGFAYRADFISVEEETALIAAIAPLPLRAARYKDYEARRRTLSFGFSYDFSANRLEPAPPMPDFLLPLRARVAQWVGLEAETFAHALLTEYAPGTPIGWHRDAPDFETVVGVSLAGHCRMRFRPYPHVAGQGRRAAEVSLAPRSAYVLRDGARWRWQHHIPPATEHRYSITYRTLRAHRGAARGSGRGQATI